MTDTIPPLMSPWHPTTDPVDIKHWGKLQEEIGELQEVLGKLQAAVARCMIQGIDESHPITNFPNKEWLENELADVQAGIGLIVLRFTLDQERMGKRTAGKMKQLAEWHRMA